MFREMFSDDDGGNDEKENDDIDDGHTTGVKMVTQLG